MSSTGSEMEEEPIHESYRDWRTKKIVGDMKRLYIRECNLSSLHMEISFLARKSIERMGGKQS